MSKKKDKLSGAQFGFAAPSWFLLLSTTEKPSATGTFSLSSPKTKNSVLPVPYPSWFLFLTPTKARATGMLSLLIFPS